MLEELLDAVDGIACAVDAENRIVAVGRRRWDRFAVENGAPELSADRVIGRNPFDVVSGTEITQAYRDLIGKVFSTGEPVVVNLCVDGPGVTRELRLSVAPLRLGEHRPGLLFQAQIVSETARPRLDVSDFKALLNALTTQGDLPTVAMCGFCQQVRRPGSGDQDNGDWVAADEYRRLGGTGRVRISQGMCPDCDAVRFAD